MKKIGGIGKFIAIIRSLDPVLRQKISASLAKTNPIYARLIERSLFLFEDLARLDDKSLQILISKVEEEKLLHAWKITSPRVKEVLLKNMSARKREDFEQRFSMLGKVPIVQVIRCQIHIARLAQDGLIKGMFHTRNR